LSTTNNVAILNKLWCERQRKLAKPIAHLLYIIRLEKKKLSKISAQKLVLKIFRVLKSPREENVKNTGEKKKIIAESCSCVFFINNLFMCLIEISLRHCKNVDGSIIYFFCHSAFSDFLGCEKQTYILAPSSLHRSGQEVNLYTS
jgi:hypothetical protein